MPLLASILLACTQPKEDTSAGEPSYPFLGTIVSGNVPHISVNGEEIPVTVITPTITQQWDGVCPNDDIYSILSDGQIIYDTKILSSVNTLANSSKLFTDCLNFGVGWDYPEYSGYSSVLNSESTATTLDMGSIQTRLAEITSDADDYPVLENSAELDNGNLLIPFLNDAGHLGAVSYNQSNGDMQLLFSKTIPLDSSLDHPSLPTTKLEDGKIVLKYFVNEDARETNPYVLKNTTLFDPSEGTLLYSIDWNEEPIYSADTRTLEGTLFSDLADHVEANIYSTATILHNGDIYFISTPVLDYDAGVVDQSGPSTLVRVDPETGAREETTLPIYGVDELFFNESKNQYVLTGYTNPQLSEETSSSYADLSLFFLDIDTGTISGEQTLLLNQQYDSAGLVEYNSNEMEYTWNNTFVVQYPVDDGMYQDYYEYNDEAGTYDFIKTENAKREISVEAFSYTTDLGETLSVDPGNGNLIAFQSDETVYQGFNKDYLYVNPVEKQAYYFQNLLQSDEPCVLFDAAGETYSSCEREAGEVSLLGNNLYLGLQETVVSFAKPE